MTTVDLSTRAVFHRGRPAGYRGRRRAAAGRVTAVRTGVRIARAVPPGREVARWVGIVVLSAYVAAVLVLGLLAGTGVG